MSGACSSLGDLRVIEGGENALDFHGGCWSLGPLQSTVHYSPIVVYSLNDYHDDDSHSPDTV